MRLSFLPILLVLTTTVYSQTPCGRVQIKDGTLVTDKGNLLRGAHFDNHESFYNFTSWNQITSEKDIIGIKNLGLNCIRLFVENPWIPDTPGCRAAPTDSVVKWTRNNSMYLIITWSGWVPNEATPSESFAHNYSFWNFYAPRYKDETHVIYEITNEPGPSWDSIKGVHQMDSSAIEMNREAYQIIRSLAPETHILFLTPWNIYYDNFISDIKKLGDGIDWNNASIAGHAYWKPAQDNITPIRNLKNAGYALTITEFASLENEYANLALTRVFEQEFISYAHFISAKQIIANPAVFKSRIESSEVRWTPDFGIWPASITEINYERPYKYWPVIFYDEGAGFQTDWTKKEIEYITNSSYIAYYNLDFGDGPGTFEAECSSQGGAGTIELHLDSLNGTVVDICPVTNTGDWNKYETFSSKITTRFTGIHKLYLVFKKGNKDYIFNLKSWYFTKSELVMPQTPYHGTASVLPGKIEAEEYDNGGLTISFLELDTIKNGLPFRNDAVDTDTTLDGGYCIGWTEPGEWLEYTVSCEQATAMDIQLRIACTAPGDKIKIKLNNKALATASFPNTGGFQNWETVTIEDIAIPAGENQVLRLELLGGDFNLDWLNFVESSVTGIDEVNNSKLNISHPTRFQLFDSYPNPFNPSTTITFSLPTRSFVSLKIYDALGREVAVLVDELLPVGNHLAVWNSVNMSSGMYFYRLQAGSFNQTKKFILLK